MAIRAREYTHNKASRVLVKARPSWISAPPCYYGLLQNTATSSRPPALRAVILAIHSPNKYQFYCKIVYRYCWEASEVKKRVTVNAAILVFSEEVSRISSPALRVFLPALGPQRMKKNQTPASQSALRTTRHGAGPHGHPPGPSEPHLHGESVTGHPAVSRSELSIKVKRAGLTNIIGKTVLLCS